MADANDRFKTMLYLNGVSVSFDGFKALNNLSIIVHPNEMLAIIGPNGAGKPTMMDIITGLTRLDEAAIANLGVGRKFQKPTVFESHTVWDNLEMALKKPRGVFSTWSYVAANDDVARINEILDTIRFSARKGDLAAGLSHGQKQWLEIGMLLAQDPKLLLVAEPVAGMTDAETVETAKLLKEIAQTRSVMVVEPDMSFMREQGSRVSGLAEGSVLAEGTLDQVSANPVVIERYLGR